MGHISINLDSLKANRDWKRFKLKDGDNIYRILPPFGDKNIHKGYPYRKWSVAWLMDPTTGRRRAYASPLTDGNDKCPVYEYLIILNDKIEKLRDALKSKGLDDKAIKEKLKPLTDHAWDMRIQHNYVYNAADKSGVNGLLELKSTAHKGIKKKMQEYITDYSQDPTSLNSADDDSGVWFNVSKTGEGKQTEYDAQIAQIKRKEGNKLIKEDDREPLSDNIVENYEKIGYDLNSLYPKKSYEDLKEILLWNIAVAAKETPAVVVTGFDITGINVELKQSDKKQQSSNKDTVDEEPQQKVKGKAPINLNLDEDDALGDLELPKEEVKVSAPLQQAKATTPIQVPKTNIKTPPTDDIFALADSILND